MTQAELPHALEYFIDVYKRQHAVRVIGIDNKNNITFAVYGYMARGSHEGEVGVGIYYYDAAENKIEEKAFITSTKSFAIRRV